MTERIVRHSIFRFPHPELEGVESLAMRGQVVDLPAHVEASADVIGALEPLAVPTEVVAVAVEEAPSSPVRPKRVSPKDEWLAYALAQGGDPDAVEASTKEELVAVYGG